jgi:hypothetical protein
LNEPHYTISRGQRRRLAAPFELDCIHGIPLNKVCRECAPIPRIEGGKMTPEQFGFFVRGLVTAAMPNAQMTCLVLDAARDFLSGTRVAAAPVPALKMLKVPQFCLHNVSVQEHCAGCAGAVGHPGVVGGSGGRLFGFHLPVDCRAVYIATSAHATTNPASALNPAIYKSELTEPDKE